MGSIGSVGWDGVNGMRVQGWDVDPCLGGFPSEGQEEPIECQITAEKMQLKLGNGRKRFHLSKNLSEMREQAFRAG